METQIPRQVDEFQLQEIDDELLLYHPAKTATLYLNPQAALIWRMCDGSRNVAEVVALLEDAYPEQRNQIQADVHNTIKQFVRQGALTIEEGGVKA